MHLFYTPDITSGDLYTLSEEESKHCSRVLRLRKGDVIHLTDGRGILFETQIVDDQIRKISVRVRQQFVDWGKRPYRLHVAIAPTKNTDRFEWFLEKATEIGIDEITPLICEHAERKSLHTERLKKILVAALKQSLTTWLPKLNEPFHLREFIQKQTDDTRYIAHYDEKHDQLKDVYRKGARALIMIGPEGDFIPEEVDAAIVYGFAPVNLGNSRLRTETAGIVACSIISTINV